MRTLLALVVGFMAVYPAGSASPARPQPPAAPIVAAADGGAASQAPAGLPQLPDEETHEDDTSAVLRTLPDHHGQLSVPHYHEYLFPRFAILGYPPLIPPDGTRA